MDQVVKQIRTLIEYLNANTRLYDEGNPAISDKLWDEKYFELNPFNSLDFSVKDIYLAGSKLSINVEKGWNKIIVDGKLCDKAILDRNGNHTVEFIV